MRETATSAIPMEALGLYRLAVAATPGAEIKANFGFPYTAVNGNMHSFLDKSGTFALRLTALDRIAFCNAFGGTPYVHETGTVLNEYLAVPFEVLANTDLAVAWLGRSLDYARTLKPKPVAGRAAA